MTKHIYPNWTIEEFLETGRRLKNISTGVWNCDASPLGTDDTWFCPAMFEQLCIMDEELERMFKNYKGTEKQKAAILKHIKDVSLRHYLQLIVQKFNQLAPQMVDYFDTLYKTKNWEQDKKEFVQCPNNGIEPTNVKKDRFII